jgi:hypothetical protein
MPFLADVLWAVMLLLLLPVGAYAEGIDTEHLFGFMIGSDVGDVGEREFQSQSTGRFSKGGGSYQALDQELELEWVPAKNFRVEFGGAFAMNRIVGVPGLTNVSQVAWQGASLDLRYQFLDRDTAPVGLTVAVETHADRTDDNTAAAVHNYGTGWTLAMDRELIPKFIVAAFNLSYQPEWTRFAGSFATQQQEATIGAAFAVMMRVRPGFFLGGEGRYLRKFEGIGLDALSGHAFFVGPTAYLELSDRSRLTAAWNIQAWGHSAARTAALDLVDFERHQARLIFGINF